MTVGEPTPAPEASGPGRLVVVVPGGWANVYEGSGRFLGATPIKVRVRIRGN